MQTNGLTAIESRGCSNVVPESKTKVADNEWCNLESYGSKGTCWYKGDRTNVNTPSSKTHTSIFRDSAKK